MIRNISRSPSQSHPAFGTYSIVEIEYTRDDTFLLGRDEGENVCFTRVSRQVGSHTFFDTLLNIEVRPRLYRTLARLRQELIARGIPVAELSTSVLIKSAAAIRPPHDVPLENVRVQFPPTFRLIQGRAIRLYLVLVSSTTPPPAPPPTLEDVMQRLTAMEANFNAKFMALHDAINQFCTMHYEDAAAKKE